MQLVQNAHQGGLIYDGSGKNHLAVIQPLHFQATQPIRPFVVEMAFDADLEKSFAGMRGRAASIIVVHYIHLPICQVSSRSNLADFGREVID
jgi:hypothetical protein